MKPKNHAKFINVDAAIKLCGGNKTVALDLILNFKPDLIKIASDVEAAHSKQDWALLSQRLHQLKGACLYTGMERLIDVIKDYEHAVSARDVDQLSGLNATFQHEVKCVLELLANNFLAQ